MAAINGMMGWRSVAKDFILEDEAQAAIAYFQEKYSKNVSVVWCNPDQLPSGVTTLCGVPIRARRTVIRSHIFLGSGDEL